MARDYAAVGSDLHAEWQRFVINEDADIREAMRADRRATACTCDASSDPPTGHRPWCGTEPEPWCPEHGYGCEPQNCPCGHSLRCDCREIAAYEH